ncbi:hypothetical protein R6242_21710 [Iodobacter sp. CM08]|uniref:hypothetical protein n=1 Tax=Iodobacter sp. CM08 TaxID=3085902 RepID=UPI0029815E04|nr:hypothetical protein [Iodobacter sp. CM08]MDW5419194.1 hypothetical protein [Iodobacter sp. CM08]
MDEAEKARVYAMLQMGEHQTNLVTKALVDLGEERRALAQVFEDGKLSQALHLEQVRQVVGGMAKTSEQIQKAAERAIPAIKLAAADAVAESMTGVNSSALDAMREATKPFLSRLEGATAGAEGAAKQLEDSSAWFSWKWLALTAAACAGLLLVCWLLFRALVWWEGSNVTELREQQRALLQQIAQDQITADALAKKVHGIRFVAAKDGDFINAPRGFEAMTCVGGVQCIKLK